MFKLADPDSGRRVLQVWDKDGTKLYTTLLTIPDQRMEASDKPVVMFSERPSGQAQAIKSWFYPDERIGQEFVYPKQQAMQLAKENHAAVLSYTDDSVKSNDSSALRSAKVGRIDENGQAVENRADNNATTARSVQSASTTAPAAATSPADNDNAASTTTTRAGARTAESTTAQSNANPSATPPSANRTQSAPAVGTSGTTAPSNTASNRRSAGSTAVATTGTTAKRSNNNVNNSRANQSDRGANAGAARRSLPRTASPLAMLELLSGLALAGGFGLRQLRRESENRV
jgi:hypothetical protein